MNHLSLDAAVTLTGLSRSTLQRRVRDGALAASTREGDNRVLLALPAVLALSDLRLDAEDLRQLLAADAGDAAAQADVGALLYVAGRAGAALYWLHKAAAQDNAEAMHWLATACAAGEAGAGLGAGGGMSRSRTRRPSPGLAARRRWGIRLRAHS